ncbi:MAG: phosphoribosylanthranilate isomerase [Candidatus Zixiibacteriota bacterium]
MAHTRIKICGITRMQDAIAVRDSGCDLMGLVFWPGSPRYVTERHASELVAAVSPDLETVGVFVDAGPDEIAAVARSTGITAAQLHGVIRPGPWAELGKEIRLIRAIPVDSRPADPSLQIDAIDDYLFDHGGSGLHGGTGRTFDWSLIEGARSWGRVWLAGGIHPGNVPDAIAQVRPYAIDVSSGVETAPGIKSPERIAALVHAVRQADARRTGQ